MKKFTLLLAFLVCAIGFSQQEPSATSWAYNNPDRVQQSNTSDLNLKENSTVTFPQNSIENLLTRLSELNNVNGSISDYFTQVELQMLKAYYSSIRTSTVDSRIMNLENTSGIRSIGECSISSPNPINRETVTNSSDIIGTRGNNSAVIITHNLNDNADLEILCTSVDTVADNIVWSEYDLDDDFGITDDFEVTDVTISIRTGGTNGIPGAPEPTITVNIYSNDGVFPGGTQTLQGTANYTVTSADLDTIVTIPVAATIPFGDNLLYEIVVPDHNPNLGAFRFGVNDPASGVDSWILSVACGLVAPATLTSIGFPSVFIMSVIGDEAGGGGGGGGTGMAYCAMNATGEYGTFDPADGSVVTPIGPSPATAFEGAGAIDVNDPDTAYAFDGNDLYSIDVTTGTYTLLGAIAAPLANGWTGMAFDPVSGTPYALAIDIGGGVTNLYTIDVGGLSATLVGTVGTPGGAIALAIDGSGVGYTHDIVDDSSYSIDLGTGAGTLLGATGFDANFGQGMGWDSGTDTVYLAAFNNGLFDSEWRTMDTTTGATALITQMDAGGLTQYGWVSISGSGGGGGGGCTAGVYADRATFDAETAGGAMNFEDWGGGPGVISGCDAPFNSSGNSCFAPGEILDGIEVLSSDMSQVDPVAYFPGGSGFNDDDAVGSNYFVDYTVINFPDNDVNSFGLDIYGIFAGGPFEVRIFGAGGLITTESVNVAGATPTFFGYIAGETIVSVEIEDLTGVNAEFVAQVSFGECTGGGGGGTLTECDSPALPIPDNDPVGISTTITVADSNPIDNVTVDLDISHTWVGDMIVTLESPSGTVITLIDQMGVPASGFGCSEDDLDITLDDDATDPIEDECSGSPITGSYTPQEALSAFDTEDMLGDWILTVSDNAGGDTGTINTWCLNFEFSGGGGDNDDCANATPIACGETLSGDTSDNTDTNGGQYPDLLSPDEWFAFTSTQVGELVTVSTCDQAAYDTRLSVYDDCTLTNQIAENDDGAGCSGFTSELQFVADGSSTYYIAVDGFNGASGTFDLTVTCSTGPLNDLCSNAIAVDCGESVSGTTIDATIDDDVAPTCDTGVTSPGVWYAFTDSSGLVSDVTITMCSGNGTADYDSKLSVYTGDCGAPPLTCVVGNDDTCGLQSEVTFQSDGSTTYLILVHGFGGATGDFTIDINCVPIPPPNDDIVNAIDVVDCTFTDEDVAMPAATTEGGNPIGCDISGANGVWYKFLPDTDGSMTCTIDQPAGTSSVTFYTAPDGDSSEDELELVDYFDNQCVPGTTTTIPTVAGQWYYTFVVNTGGVTDISFECDLLGVDDNQIAGFSYYPNPADETINLSALDNIENVALYNILGQNVIDLNVDAISTQVNVSNLSTGTYIMKVTVGDQIGTYKVLKR